MLNRVTNVLKLVTRCANLEVPDFHSNPSTGWRSLSVFEGYYLCLTVPSNIQLHGLSMATLISANSVEYMTICLQKLPISLLES